MIRNNTIFSLEFLISYLYIAILRKMHKQKIRENKRILTVAMILTRLM